MRYLSFIFLLLLFLTSCDTDFELEAPWQDIAIVYGFLSRQDTAHYIRVEKAFLEPGGDATQIALIPDSIYYGPEVLVELERINSGQRFTLERVDGNLEGYPRADGPFVSSPNILYKIKASTINLREGEDYQLRIDRGGDLPIVTAETTIIEDLVIRENNPVSPINMAYDRNVTFVFNAGEAAQLFDVRLRIRYRERESNGPSVNKELIWVLADQLERSSSEGRVSVSVMGEEFYRFIGGSLEANPALRRDFVAIDVLLAAGGQEMVDFIRVSEANTGITSSQLVPTFTNISEGRGIFTSRSVAERLNLTLTGLSVDSLQNGIYTRDLNF